LLSGTVSHYVVVAIIGSINYLKIKSKPLFKKWLVVLLLFFSGACLVRYYYSEKSVSQLAPDISPNKEQKLKDEKLLNWIKTLETFENCPVEGIKDSNGKKSYGSLCWQMDSFKEYTLKYIPESKNWEKEDWQNNIMDNEFQEELTYLIIKNTPDKARSLWHTTIVKKGLGLP